MIHSPQNTPSIHPHQPEAQARVNQPEAQARVNQPEAQARVNQPEAQARVHQPEALARVPRPYNHPIASLIHVILMALILNGGATSTLAVPNRDILLDAQNQYEQSHFEQALKLYQQADAQGEGNHSIDYNIGLCHLRLGDGEKAVRQFEAVASDTAAPASLRVDAFYNIGYVRATAARKRLEETLAPATQPAEQQAKDEARINELQAVADELLRAIGAFREARDLQPDEEIEHNIRAARILRRNVLGLLNKEQQEKEKKDMLDDPGRYLAQLITEQDTQVSLSRYMLMVPVADPVEERQTRRSAVRLQRKTMEKTNNFADQLAQFKEKVASSAPASTQPAEETPREKIYKAIAAELKKAVDFQRDACAFFLDAERKPGYDQQKMAVERMKAASLMFPVEPAKALAGMRMKLATLRAEVEKIEAPSDWLQDPLIGRANLPDNVSWDSKDTAIYSHQQDFGPAIAKLIGQCQYLATATQPADTEQMTEEQKQIFDPELNAKLVEILKDVPATQEHALTAIEQRNKTRTLAEQKSIIEAIEKALALFPKSIEERLGELVVRQYQLNEQTKAEAAGKNTGNEEPGGTLGDKLRKWAAELKTKVLRKTPASITEQIKEQQQRIEQETVAVHEEIKKQIPTSQTPAGPQQSQEKVQAYIEAGKHLDQADFEMLSAIEGLDRAIVENSLKRMEAQGPVQTAQGKALEELLKALFALQPPEQQPQQQQKQDQDQKQQPPPQQQDMRRSVEQMDRQREEAERQLHQPKPRTNLKDW